MIAWYLQTSKPKSKLIVLDANKDIVSKTGLFKSVFKDYPNLEYRPAQKVEKIDVGAKEVTTDIGDKVNYDVINLIPPQRANSIAVEADAGGSPRLQHRLELLKTFRPLTEIGLTIGTLCRSG
jgi:NADPH-dependent 2,4-dienoyl-CoA reductase/sulfur reductase-like enzyme